MKKLLTISLLISLLLSIVGCAGGVTLTSTAEYEDCILSLDSAEVSTNEEQKQILTVQATYTNNNSEPLYALSCFGVKVFQDDVEQTNISNINGSEEALIKEIKDGQSLQVSYVFELTTDSPVEILVCTPTANEEIIARLDYPPQEEE